MRLFTLFTFVALTAILLHGCTNNPESSGNLAPIISSITITPAVVSPNASCTVSVTAMDPDKESILYSFSASGNIILTAEAGVVRWKPLAVTGSYIITVVVSDKINTVIATAAVMVGSSTNSIIPSENSIALLSVSGRHILSPSGNTITLKGVGFANNVYHDNAAVSAWDHDLSDLTTVHIWGANVIRFYMHANWFSPSNIQNTWTYLDQNLQWAKQNNLYLILDMHYAPGQTITDLNPLWNSNSHKQSLISIWQQISTRYKNNPAVAGYDLLNEPAPAQANSWWSLAQKIIDAIRAQGDHHVIFLENLNNLSGSASFPTANQITDSNLVYSFHFYEPIEFTHQGTSWTNRPVGVTYPYTKMDYINYIGGYYDGPGWGNWKQKNTWLELVPTSNQWATPPTSANVGFIQFGSDSNPGTIWADDIQLIKRNPNGTTENVTLTNPSFSEMDPNGQLLGWYPEIPTQNQAVCSWDKTKGRTDSYSVKISNCVGPAPNTYASWSQDNNLAPWYYPRFGFVIEPGCTYQIRGWVYADNNCAGYTLFKFNWQKMANTAYNKTKLGQLLADYNNYGINHNVPIYCGEFGTVGIAPGTSASDYIRDVTDSFAAKGISWTYHDYRDYLGTTNPTQRRDFGLFSVAEGSGISGNLSSLASAIKNILFP